MMLERHARMHLAVELIARRARISIVHQADLPNALATVPFRNQWVGIKIGDGLLPTP